MTRRIRILPDHLVNQIAAGEVVERPASVVKELVENALDAGAARVAVDVRNGGKTEIRVADDGQGMGREDALLALDRHATSKIQAAEDLAAVRTLGFRGEALPSIASVSRMVVETAERDGDGTKLIVKGGQLTFVEACPRRVGTTISVRSLFFNTPARAKFLRSTAAETRAISEVVTGLALAFPQVAFTLESNDRVLLELAPASQLRGRLADIWGREGATELIPVAFEARHAAISGLIERPHAATAAGRRGHLFVNGRSFADRSLVRAVDRGYHTTIPPGVRPSFFLFIDVPDGEVDVNVHPTKAEVRFRHAAGVGEAIEAAVRNALRPLESAPTLGARGDVGGADAGGVAAGGVDASGSAQGSSPSGRTGSPADPSGGQSASDVGLDQMSLFVTRSTGTSNGAPSSTDDLGTDMDGIRPALWQVHHTYIFAETRDGLIILDQHAAHERVIYEELMREWDRPEARSSQRLLFPLTIRLAPAELDVVEQLRPLFTRIGYEIADFGPRSIIVHAVPNPHPYFDAERCLRDMIQELNEGSELTDGVRNQHQRLALSYACKAAIKAGQPLTDEEISELFDRLFATELPFHDVHGRPTVVQLSMSELHNRFRRSG